MNIDITDDYVSFELAKLLKEKGFDVPCEYFYVDGKLVMSQGFDCNWNGGESLYTDYKNECSAPTIQMVMKWLRVQHNLHIMVDCIGSENYMPTIQFTCNSKDIMVESNKSKIGGNGFDSFEDACESAIKYCLDNLI